MLLEVIIPKMGQIGHYKKGVSHQNDPYNYARVGFLPRFTVTFPNISV